MKYCKTFSTHHQQHTILLYDFKVQVKITKCLISEQCEYPRFKVIVTIISDMVRYAADTSTLVPRVDRTRDFRARGAPLAIHFHRCIRTPIPAIIWVAMRRRVPARRKTVSSNNYICSSVLSCVCLSYYYYSILAFLGSCFMPCSDRY